MAGTTYSVSLPKPWVQKYGLESKDFIYLLENGDGSLLLNSRERKGKKLDDSFCC